MKSAFSLLSSRSLLIFLAFLSLLPVTCLQAGGWGKRDTVVEHEGTTWNEVYFDMNGVNYIASIPNYSMGSLENGNATLKGFIDGAGGYVIETSLNAEFTPATTANGFLKMIQKANPNYTVVLVDAKKHGALYGVDLVPANDKVTAYWRFLTTKNRLIKMGTDDSDAKRQAYFFDSIRIKK